ncbi:hypothetical protein [Amycolatopsis sp. NPDC059657]|uniref:hypothetical protein n=1 Tax=Amycolatopsis sp. NPDC059657 TaxID=3346899 RepID=UPI00366D1502
MAPNNSSDSGSKVALGDNSQAAAVVEQARGRSDGFEVGGDRAITATPNWNAQSSTTLYQQATANNNPKSAYDLSHGWHSHGTELNTASNELYSAISELGAAWVGKGAGAAQGALVGIANSGSQASEAAKVMGERLRQQAEAAERVRQMPAPQEFDPAAELTKALATGATELTVDQKAKSDQANAVKAQQVAMMNAYTQSLAEVDSTTPSFGPDSLGMKPLAGTHTNTGFNSVGGINAMSVGSTGSAAFVSGGRGAGYSGGVPGSAGADGADFAGSAGAPGSMVPGGPGAGAVSGAGNAPVMPHAPGGSNLGLGLGIGGAAGGIGAVAAARTLGQGNRSGSKAKGPEETEAAAQDGQGQSAASANQPQQGLVNQAGTIGGQGAPPPGMGGMGGMGGAHAAHAEEEQEHTHASFLIEADPDATFGADQAATSPVIGAWSDEDDR